MGWWPSVARSQEATRPEPEYNNTVYWHDAAANALRPLERQVLKMRTKPKALGLAGMSNTLQAEGAKSPTRFASNQVVSFVLKAPPGVDPQTLIQLVKLTEAKDHRELLTSQLNTLSIHNRNDISAGRKAEVAFQVKRYSDSAVEISAAAPLEPGEYALRVPLGSTTAFCFGID